MGTHHTEAQTKKFIEGNVLEAAVAVAARIPLLHSIPLLGSAIGMAAGMDLNGDGQVGLTPAQMQQAVHQFFPDTETHGVIGAPGSTPQAQQARIQVK